MIRFLQLGKILGTEKEIIRKLTLGEVNDDTLTIKILSQYWW